MGRIAGWKKIYESRGNVVWINRTVLPTYLQIIRLCYPNEYAIGKECEWLIETDKRRDFDNGWGLANRTTKAQALKVATRWMRTHPRG